MAAVANAFGYWRRGSFVPGWSIHLAAFGRYGRIMQTSAFAAAPHPDPLPARGERGRFLAAEGRKVRMRREGCDPRRV